MESGDDWLCWVWEVRIEGCALQEAGRRQLLPEAGRKPVTQLAGSWGASGWGAPLGLPLGTFKDSQVLA